MEHRNKFFNALGIGSDAELKELAEKSGVSVVSLKYYDESNIIPSGHDLRSILAVTMISELELMLRMGRLDHHVTSLLQTHAAEIYQLIGNGKKPAAAPQLKPVFTTSLGSLYGADCIDLMRGPDDDCIDLIFGRGASCHVWRSSSQPAGLR